VLRVNEALVEGLTGVLAEHLGVDRNRVLAPRLIASLGNSAMRCAIDAWIASGGEKDLRTLAEEALGVVEPAVEAALASLQAARGAESPAARK
jgi:hypothetical protein